MPSFHTKASAVTSPFFHAVTISAVVMLRESSSVRLTDHDPGGSFGFGCAGDEAASSAATEASGTDASSTESPSSSLPASADEVPSTKIDAWQPLQRTLTRFPRTFSSAMEYLDPQASQVIFIVGLRLRGAGAWPETLAKTLHGGPNSSQVTG